MGSCCDRSVYHKFNKITLHKGSPSRSTSTYNYKILLQTDIVRLQPGFNHLANDPTSVYSADQNSITLLGNNEQLSTRVTKFQECIQGVLDRCKQSKKPVVVIEEPTGIIRQQIKRQLYSSIIESILYWQMNHPDAVYPKKIYLDWKSIEIYYDQLINEVMLRISVIH